MWIKICANTNLADAQLAADLGADAVGFVFAPSKRQVTPEQAAAITAGLSGAIEKVGVFSTSNAAQIQQTVASAGLTAVQMHGALDISTVRRLAKEFGEQLKIIQTVVYEVDVDREAADRGFEAALAEACAEPALWAVLIDASQSGASGGLGVAFDWTRVATLLDRACENRAPAGHRPRIILAGGLRAENVAMAIGALDPWGVDVASGVEAIPGRKHPERLRQFLAAARR